MTTNTSSTGEIICSGNGCVKWFNSKHKYGFITVLSDGDYKNTDIFVHQSNIITKEPCYRFLVAGENVIFEIKKTDNEKHPIQTVNISGLNNVTLQCEIPRPPRVNNDRRGEQEGRGGYRGSQEGRGGQGYRGSQEGRGGQGYRGSQEGRGGQGYRGSQEGRGGYRGSQTTEGGNTYRGNNYRGNNYRGNNYRGNNVDYRSKNSSTVTTETPQTTSS